MLSVGSSAGAEVAFAVKTFFTAMPAAAAAMPKLIVEIITAAVFDLFFISFHSCMFSYRSALFPIKVHSR
jgi:uncharacterized membrane protein